MDIQQNLRKQSNLLWQGLLLVAFVILAGASGTQKKVATPGYEGTYIKIRPEKTETFTTPSLQRFVKDNEGASVVVRDSKAAKEEGVSGNSQSSKLCALIESALLKHNFNVRDRQIFENVANKMGDNIDYVDLSKKTGTDLIFEVTDFGEDMYVVNKSYANDGKETQFYARKITGYDKKNKPVYGQVPMSYEFYGYHIEIKVIMLRENKVGGTYRYYYTPCSEERGGCQITSTGPPLRYFDNNDNKNYEKSDDRKADKDENLYQELNNFISKTVIPGINQAMREEQ